MNISYFFVHNTLICTIYAPALSFIISFFITSSPTTYNEVIPSLEFSPMKHHSTNKSIFIIFLLIPLAAGALSALFTGNMSGSYASFTKPSFAPPGILFPIIWTILYLLMGVSSYIVAQSDHPDKLLALRTYFIQLFFNFMWSILFFGLSNYLQIPYLFWCIFAAILNFAVYLLN